jgi:hypothetical protein
VPARPAPRRGTAALDTQPDHVLPRAGRSANPFHTRELAACELAGLVRKAGFADVEITGLHHGPRLRELDARHGGSLVDAQVAVAVGGGHWPPALLADVASVTAADFVLQAADVDASLDLVAVATRP